ncbi:MAG: membrane dipeptidase [Clostridiales bacterium]|nr:membrane dipeptidase [Clostridiales bacterium]
MFPVADGHCDYLYGAVQSGYDLKNPKRAQAIRLEDLMRGGVALQFFACWIDTALQSPPLHQCIAMIDAYHRMLETYDELTPLTRDFAPESGKIATVLSVEGGEAVDGSLSVLRVLYRLGVRAMTLTWNENNELAGAAMGRGNKGLSAIGRDIIDEMCALGMAIDVSHLSDRGIEQVLARATRPVFASHSNARGVHDHPRSLSDALIRDIAKQGGTVGVNFYYQQLTKNAEACIDDILRHICRVVEIGGVGCCAIGSDLDGMQQYPKDLKTSRDFPALFDALIRHGFSEADVYRIAYQNLRDYIVQFV